MDYGTQVLIACALPFVVAIPATLIGLAVEFRSEIRKFFIGRA